MLLDALNLFIWWWRQRRKRLGFYRLFSGHSEEGVSQTIDHHTTTRLHVRPEGTHG